MAEPRALMFDVFGTCVDWRSGVIRAGEELGLGGVDWPALADAWRGRYQPQLETVRSGERPWVDLDVLHREALDELLPRFGLADLPEPQRRELTRSWHRLDGWPDTAEGLGRLKRRFVIASCSNGHIALSVALARHAGLPWDAVLGAELARAYKPQPEVYLRSVEALGLEPAQAMMVAAHPGDLAAAAACGLRTAYVHRPDEHGPGGSAEPPAAGAVDLVAGDLIELAGRLGA
jgi:2-haloacid dehalogenase